MGSPSAVLGDLVSLVLLILEMNGLSVLLVNLCGDGVEGYSMMCFMSGMGILVAKKLIRTLLSVMPIWATLL